MKITVTLPSITTLMCLNISNNNIDDEVAGDAVIIFHNTELQQLHLHENSLCAAGAIKIVRALQTITTLKVLNLESNVISDEAADDITQALSHLQEVYLIENNLQAAGARKIARALQDSTTLTVFDIEENNISNEAMTDITAVLSQVVSL